jgi:hypothetical protein
MNVYALSYRNPHDPARPFVLFLASARHLEQDEALAAAIETVKADGLGHEWVEAVANGSVCGPLEIEGELRQPSIAVAVE